MNFNPRSPHGERPPVCDDINVTFDFNPRSPHGERPHCLHICIVYLPFQSTLPARGATGDGFQRSQPYKFQSTLPARGATTWRCWLRQPTPISIHAPRTGSDHQALQSCNKLPTISIHAPRTGSDQSDAVRLLLQPLQFQSTLPARGATERGSGDWQDDHQDFNPRSPHGERLYRSSRYIPS